MPYGHGAGREKIMARATVTIYSRSYASILAELQRLWERDRKNNHLQATGMVLGQVGQELREIARLLDITLDYMVVRRGIHGIDGLLLSLMSAAQYIDSRGYSRAMGLLETLLRGQLEQPKQGMLIPFLDFGVGHKTGFSGSRSQDVRVQSITGLLTGFPDSLRRGIGELPSALTGGMDLGAALRAIGNHDMSRYSSGERMGYFQSTEACVAFVDSGLKSAVFAGFTVAGAAIGGPVGAGLGMAAGAFAAEFVAPTTFTAEYVCGASTEPEPAPAPAPDPGGTPADTPPAPEPAPGTPPSEEEDSPPPAPEEPADDDPNAAGTCSGGTQTSYVNPDADAPASTQEGMPGGALLAALGIHIMDVDLARPMIERTNGRARVVNPLFSDSLGSGNHMLTIPTAEWYELRQPGSEGGLNGPATMENRARRGPGGKPVNPQGG